MDTQPEDMAALTQDEFLQGEADKLGVTLEEMKERITLVNNASNTFGQLAMQLTSGNWDVTLSIAGTFLASTIAQTALVSGKTPADLWAFIAPGIENTAGILHAAFAEAEAITRAEIEAAAKATAEGEGAYPANGNDVPKVG